MTAAIPPGVWPTIPPYPVGVAPELVGGAEVRVYCHAHGVCLFEGADDPEGGADGVWARSGCPALGAPQTELDACPNRGQRQGMNWT